MNKTYHIGTILCMMSIVFLTNSCNDLDLLPLDRVTAATFYNTKEDFDGAIFGSYSSIQKFWENSTETLGETSEYWKITLSTTDDIVADEVVADGRSQDLDNLLFRPSDVPFQAIYSMIYEGILRANVVLQNLEGDNELTSDEKSRFEGEAKFLRAFFHFQALKMWGTPPLVTSVRESLNDLDFTNTDQTALYDQILADFDVAFSTLPDDWGAGDMGRATKWAAKAFIGKLNVWKEDWPAAITAFEEVIASGKYTLMDNYEDVFAGDMENNQESIFEIQFGGPFSDDNLWVFDDIHSENFKASQGISRSHNLGASNGAPGGSRGWHAPSQDLVEEFEEGDPRLEISIYREGDTYFTPDFTTVPYDPEWSITNYSIKKYLGERNMIPANLAPNRRSDFINERWYRYSELLLLYAEALIETGRTGEALEIINGQIRARVGLGPTPFSDPVEALRHEKRVEMAFEPHRWFDITRWEIGAEIFGDKWEDRLNLFPFPQSEIDRAGGGLTQNPGY